MGVGSPDDIASNRLNPRNPLPDPHTIKVGMAFDEEDPWGNKNGKPSNRHTLQGMFDGKAYIKHGLRGENG